MRAIIQMFRVPNLLIIVLTFLFLRYFLFIPVYSHYSIQLGMSKFDFFLMVVSTILIAAAGYMINDVFDIETDQINKPEKQYINRIITNRTAFICSLLLSLTALGLSIWLTVHLKIWIAAALLITALIVAWWYAVFLKKSLLWGNLAVSCMSAGTIAMAWIIENQSAQIPSEAALVITKIIISISIFAFLLSLMREIIKDMEDIEGDKLIKCRSLPIVKGISFTKFILYTISTFTLLLIVIIQFSLTDLSKLMAALWLFGFVEIPVLIFIRQLASARTKTNYHQLSLLLKWIMLGGLCTLIAGQF